MADTVSSSPSISIHKDDTGAVCGSFTIPGQAVSSIGAINWAALLQAIVDAKPLIMAIISAFSSSPAPPAPRTENK